MMNYKTMTTGELLAEKSHMEQIGTPGETQLLDIMEEINNRKAQSKLPQTETITYGKHAEANIKYNQNEITFWGYEGGAKSYTIPLDQFHQDQHLIHFYNSEYLTDGIKSRVFGALKKR